MKSFSPFLLFLAALACPNSSFASTYLCSGLCGLLDRTDPAASTVELTQLLGSGSSAASAFLELRRKCDPVLSAVKKNNPGVDDREFGLYVSFRVGTHNDRSSGTSQLVGSGTPATADTACIAL